MVSPISGDFRNVDHGKYGISDGIMDDCRPAQPGTAAAFESALAQCPNASAHLTQLLQGLAHQAAAEVAAGQELRAAMASKGTGPGAMDILEQAIQAANPFIHLQVIKPSEPVLAPLSQN